VTKVAEGYDSTLTVEEQVKRVFADKLEKPASEIRLDDDLLMDLGLDSLSLAEMTVHMENLAGGQFSAEDLFDACTVGDLVDLVTRKLQLKKL
jgi:acyl carrier protein